MYIIVTGSSSSELQSAMYTQSLAGYSAFGGITVSASKYSVLMGAGDGMITSVNSEITTSRLNSASISSGASPMSKIVFPPQDSVIVNINPNTFGGRTG